MRGPHGPRHAGPRLLEHQHALDVVSNQLDTRDRVNDGRLDSEEGKRGTAGLCRRNTRERRNDVGSRLGLPVRLEFY